MLYLVRENLFIGNINAAAEVLLGGNKEITHILSVLSSASIGFFSEWKSSFSVPTKEIRTVYMDGSGPDENLEGDGSDQSASCCKKIQYVLENAGHDLKLVRMAVPLRDMESENLLDYLDVCLDFIEESRKNGSVLVHCFAGVSRSAAIITAYLMRTERLSLEDALESLRQSNESVCPNDGFLEQLTMFEDMGFKVDHSNTIYKRFRLKVLGDSYNRGENIDSSKFAADPGLTKKEASILTETTSQKEIIPTPAFRCKKCRRVVALQENVINHIPGEGESSFQWQKRNNHSYFNKYDELECTSIFVEPLRWMKTVEEGALEGKLWCTHCEGRLGYFNWSGIQCSCGSWITPAFQLHRSRIDASTV
ncbi:hypothetical protein SSX86_022589 [Deinandra increscens subsp. villosa]|uniref:protein-tyrosine-phosphatase n=1 Tax=Deinandra increscens subsp. villosa TaxID=3103831 RepID=A0AAP0GQF3_9ASTR